MKQIAILSLVLSSLLLFNALCASNAFRTAAAIQDNLPSGTAIATGQYPEGGEIHVVVLSDPGLLTIAFPEPSGPLDKLFSAVTTYVSGAVLYFDSDGITYSKEITPNSNTLMTFMHPLTITNVRMTIDGRGYADDAAHAGYFYSSSPPPTDKLPDGSVVSLGESNPEEINNVVFADPGYQEKPIPSPEGGAVKGIFASVTTYVQDAVLYFDSGGTTYSKLISPNSNTLITFPSPITVSNVKISITDRGYPDDAANVGYFYPPPT